MTKYPTTKYFHDLLEIEGWKEVKGVVEVNHPDYKKKMVWVGDYSHRGRGEKFYISLDKKGGHVKLGGWYEGIEGEDGPHLLLKLKKENFFRRGRKTRSLKLRRLKKVGKYVEKVIKNLTT